TRVAREPSGAVVARVDGVPIGVGDVANAARRLELAPELALARLEEELLLLAEGERRGVPEGTFDEVARRRAEVRALMLAVEEETPVPPLDEAALRQAFEASGGVVTPERRGTTHVALLGEPGDAGEGPSEAALAAARALQAEVLAGTLGWDALVRELEEAGERARFRGVPAEVRRFDPFARGETTIPAAYRAAVHGELDASGLLAEPLLVGSVALVVRVDPVIPAERVDFAGFVAAREEVAHDNAVSVALQRLVAELAVGRVALEDDAVAAALADDGPLAPLTVPPGGP
ncbi:MAG: hypothetical protein AAGH15_27640, partial [Myxococcota bacterium]